MAEFRVLVVEDDPAARHLLVSILEDDGYDVSAVADGRAALEAAATLLPTWPSLTAGSPASMGRRSPAGCDRQATCPSSSRLVPIRLRPSHDGFRIGADDYIVKPFDPEELSWRVRAVLRRSGRAVKQVFQYNDVEVDERTQLVTRAGSPVPLTATEFKLLGVLVRNRTRVVPKNQLLVQVWGFESDDHTLEVHISSLRRKLEAHGPRIIQTVRGVGYALRT